MRLRAMSVLGLFLAAAGTCDNTAPPPDTCVQGQTITIGTDKTGAVAGGDCELPNAEGRRGDSYAFTLETTTSIRFNINGTTETGIRIRDNSLTGDQDIAMHDNGLSQYQTFVVLKPGSYTLDISADEPDGSGDYTIGSTILTSPQPVGCIQPPGQWRFTTIGASVSGVLASGDCAGGVNNVFDGYVVKKYGGPRTVTVTVSGPAAVEIRNRETNALIGAPGARNSAGDIVLSFVGTPDYYLISVLTQGPGVTINYTLKIE